MGEGFGVYCMGDDEVIFNIVMFVNIVCGLYVGDLEIMVKMFKFVKVCGVVVGVYFGFLDLWGFGCWIIFYMFGEIE